MNPGTLALLIPIIAIIGGLLLGAMRIRQQHGELNKQQEARLAQMQQEITALKGRIEVLEALATDEKENLKRDINNLRQA
ncbi:hypothetical protein ACRRUX_10100 [Shewanella sp. GXUN23E]